MMKKVGLFKNEMCVQAKFLNSFERQENVIGHM